MICVFFKQKTAYEMRISDWSSDVCSADLRTEGDGVEFYPGGFHRLAGFGHAPVDLGFTGGKVGIAEILEPAIGAEVGALRTGRHLVELDRKRVVEGKSVSVRVDLGGRRIIKKKNRKIRNYKTKYN